MDMRVDCRTCKYCKGTHCYNQQVMYWAFGNSADAQGTGEIYHTYFKRAIKSCRGREHSNKEKYRPPRVIRVIRGIIGEIIDRLIAGANDFLAEPKEEPKKEPDLIIEVIQEPRIIKYQHQPIRGQLDSWYHRRKGGLL